MGSLGFILKKSNDFVIKDINNTMANILYSYFCIYIRFNYILHLIIN